MRVIIQKFGGTSVARSEDRQLVVGRVLGAMEKGLSPVVVVSAMGRAGDPYATDTLISLARSVHPDTAPREIDLLASCGEIISAVVMVNTLKSAGIDAMVLSGGQAGIITDTRFTEARIVRVDPDHLTRHVGEGKVVVVAGFQGVTDAGDITTLGRGGSDTTAAALGVALRAEVVEIYTDVDGIKTADPSIVPEARTMESMTYEEICQLANEGARVVHPRAVEIAMRGNIPIRIADYRGEGGGTIITHGYQVDESWPQVRDTQVIAGVTHLKDLAQLVVPEHMSIPKSASMFRSLAQEGISVDLINASQDAHLFCVREEQADRALEVLRAEGLTTKARRGCSKVSIVGAGMRGVPGVMATVVEALAQAEIDILQTADSHLTISCLVDSASTDDAVRALHRAFGLGQSD